MDAIYYLCVLSKIRTTLRLDMNRNEVVFVEKNAPTKG